MEIQGGNYSYPQQQPQAQAVVAAPQPPAAVNITAAPQYYYIPQTLPVQQANFQFQVQAQPPSQWSTGICYSCFKSSDDFSLWCLTCWCPCITFGRIAEIVNRGTMSGTMSTLLYCFLCHFTGFEWIYTGINRSTLRAQYGLPDTPCPDLLLHCFCHKCALRQEYRELRHRGFDLNMGWNASVYKMQQQSAVAGGVIVPPIVQGGMTR